MPRTPSSSAQDSIVLAKSLATVGGSRIGLIPVGHPFPDVARHVIGPVGRLVARIGAHRRDALLPVGVVASVGDAGIPVVAPGILQATRAARRFFPLRLSGQATATPAAEGIRSEPVDADDGQLIQGLLLFQHGGDEGRLGHLAGICISIQLEVICRPPAQVGRIEGFELFPTHGITVAHSDMG